jgi:predicted signal transduction protein with EAL and GGDEF domain
VDDLLAQADIAMYKAKSSGRNTMRVFTPSMRKNLKADAPAILNQH